MRRESARFSSGSRWPTTGRCPRPTCSPSIDGSSPRRGPSSPPTEPDGSPATPEGHEGAGGFEAALRAAIGDLPAGLRTRFAPAPTGYLHLGHVANALVVWRVARESGGSVVLRIEDHDRQRCRPEYETALLDDLEALGFVPDEPSIGALRAGGPSAYRQSDQGSDYAQAVADLARTGHVYACDCSRQTFRAWASANGRSWSGPGCPGGCLGRALTLDGSGITLRAALDRGTESWMDLAHGPQVGATAPRGDPALRDQHGNWTYTLCVVVDDLRHGIDLVIRGD
ncbi:MAG: hypothetical protein EPO00_07490, partial [Chloroflexota bacterium]